MGLEFYETRSDTIKTINTGSSTILDIPNIPIGVYIITFNIQAVSVGNGRYDISFYLNGDHSKSYGHNSFPIDQIYPCMNIVSMFNFTNGTNTIHIISFCTSDYSIYSYNCTLFKIKS